MNRSELHNTLNIIIGFCEALKQDKIPEYQLANFIQEYLGEFLDRQAKLAEEAQAKEKASQAKSPEAK
jgi:hypothetical protein